MTAGGTSFRLVGRSAPANPSGFRLACAQPCSIDDGDARRQGCVWNVSARGAYLVADPVPPLGTWLSISFCLPDDPDLVRVAGVVAWRNLPSLWAGCGDTAARLPPGCGLQFAGLTEADARRIEARVRTTLSRQRGRAVG